MNPDEGMVTGEGGSGTKWSQQREPMKSSSDVLNSKVIKKAIDQFKLRDPIIDIGVEPSSSMGLEIRTIFVEGKNENGDVKRSAVGCFIGSPPWLKDFPLSAPGASLKSLIVPKDKPPHEYEKIERIKDVKPINAVGDNYDVWFVMGSGERNLVKTMLWIVDNGTVGGVNIKDRVIPASDISGGLVDINKLLDKLANDPDERDKL